MGLVGEHKPGEADQVWRKRTREATWIVHLVREVLPFKGDVVVLTGKRRELCFVEEVNKVEVFRRGSRA